MLKIFYKKNAWNFIAQNWDKYFLNNWDESKQNRRIFQFLKENLLKMVAAFPLAKLGVLVIKQISKPLANSIARRARTNDFFRNWILLPTSQLFHWADVKVRMRILNLGKVTKVPKLDEKKAIDTGAQVKKSWNFVYFLAKP